MTNELKQVEARIAELDQMIAEERSRLASLRREQLGSDADAPELLTMKEAAEFLRTPLPTLYLLISKGKMAAAKIGGRYRIHRSTLKEMIQPKLKEQA